MRRIGPGIGFIIPDSDAIHCIQKHWDIMLPVLPSMRPRFLPSQFLPMLMLIPLPKPQILPLLLHRFLQVLLVMSVPLPMLWVLAQALPVLQVMSLLLSFLLLVLPLPHVPLLLLPILHLPL
jgi:hypothetical protein